MLLLLEGNTVCILSVFSDLFKYDVRHCRMYTVIINPNKKYPRYEKFPHFFGWC